jgi:hypothetical protein
MLRRHLNAAVTAGLLASGQPIDLAALLGRFDSRRPFPSAYYTKRQPKRAISAHFRRDGRRDCRRDAVQLNALGVVLAAEADSGNDFGPGSPRGHRAGRRPRSPGSPQSPGTAHEKWRPALHPAHAKPNYDC